MHLLTLLIAAVFSSQFSKLSNSATFTVEPETVAPNAVVKVTVTETAGPSTWVAPVKLFFQATDTLAPLADAAGWVDATLDTPASNGDDTYTTDETVDFSDIADIAAGAPIYVYVQTNVTDVQTVLADPATIDVVEPWGFSSDDVDEDAFAITTIAVTKPDPDWDDAEAGANDKVKVYIADAEVDPTGVASGDWIGTGESTAYASNKYAIASLDIHDHTFAKNEKIYVYLQYNTSGGYEWADGFATITVAEAVARFSIKVPDPAKVYMGATTIASLTIAQSVAAEDAWAKANVKLRLSTDPAVVPTTGDIAIDTTTGKDHAVTTCSLSGLTLTPGGKIYVYVVLSDGSNPRVLKKRAEISVERSADPPTFDVTPKKIILAGATTIDIVVTQNNLESNAAPWTEGVSIYLTTDIAETPETTDTWIETVKDGASYKKTGITVSTLSLNDGDNLYVWVQHGVGTSSNAPAILDVPAVITVQQNPDPIFTVEPTTFALPSVMDNIVVKQVDQVTEPWPAEITVYLTLDNTKAPADIPLKRTLTRTGEAPNWVYTIERFNFRELTGIVAGNVYVHVSYQAGDPATTVVVGEKKTIAVTGTLPPLPFTVEAPEAILEAEIEEPVAFEILPGTGQVWTGQTVKLSITLTEVPPTGSSPAFTATITKQEEGANWAGSINLATLVVPEGQTKVYAHVKVGEAAYLPDFAEITYTPGAAPDPTVFVLNPATVEWAADVKLLKTEIKPTPAAPTGWPTEDDVTTMKFEILNPAAASVAAVTGTVAIEEAEGETPTKWFIPANTDIHTLVADEPTANVPLTVKISINNGVDWITKAAAIAVTPKETPGGAAMGVSPLLSLLAALVFLFVKLF